MFRLIIGTFTRMYSVYEIICLDRGSTPLTSTPPSGVFDLNINLGML